MFQELVKIDVCIFEEWRSQDVLRCKADSVRDLDCCSDQEHRLGELVSKRQFYVQVNSGFLPIKLYSNPLQIHLLIPKQYKYCLGNKQKDCGGVLVLTKLTFQLKSIALVDKVTYVLCVA